MLVGGYGLISESHFSCPPRPINAGRKSETAVSGANPRQESDHKAGIITGDAHITG